MDISAWIDRHGGFTPDKHAICYGDSKITYGELAARIGATAWVLQNEFGVARGDRVAFLGLNHPDEIVLLFACARLGAILMPMNWRLEGPEQRAVMADCTPKVLFADAGYLPRGQQILDAKITRLVGVGPCPDGMITLNDLLASGGSVDLADGQGGEDDPVLICYTSGATGRPKGVVLRQKALQANALNSRHMHGMGSDDVVLTTLPLFHVGGMNIQSTPVLYCGGTLVLHPAFDVDATFNALPEHGITLTVLVPAQISAMMDDNRWNSDTLSGLRMISTGSTLVPRALIRDVHKVGVPLIQVYGSTETCPVATYLTAQDARANEGSGGRAAMHCEIRIVDDAGRDVPAQGHGEILVRGDNVMDGYWNAPKATADALVDGWYRTGDIGWVDGAGFLYVDDRKKDMIITGGENVYPAEVENILIEAPDISEVAVVGQADEKWGETIVAVVVLAKDSTMGMDDLVALLHGRLARYKHPRRVLFIDALPRNVMGKVQKNELRQLVSEPDGTKNATEGAAS